LDLPSSLKGTVSAEKCNGYFGVPKPAPPKLDVEGCPNVVTDPKETRLLSFGEGFWSRETLASFANGLDRSGEYDCRPAISFQKKNRKEGGRVREDDWGDIFVRQEGYVSLAAA
jgi:hypothetical protein